MLAPLSWIADYVDVDLSPEVLADALTVRGIEVASIESTEEGVVLDVDVKPNRGDLLSIHGLAREIAAVAGRSLRAPEAPPGGAGRAPVGVRIEAADLCPGFSLRLLTVVRGGQSPQWMRRRLLSVGIRPVNAVVDTTNYVMHDIGQPMHAYDAGKVAGAALVVRRARAGEQLVTIDHTLRELDETMLVIADASGVIGLAGIMGGAGTEVDDETTGVLLEAAIFEGTSVRRTARRLALRSEASSRHEKGLWPQLPPLALDRATQLLAEIAGASSAGDAEAGVAAAARRDERRRVSVSVPRMGRLLGLSLEAGRIGDLLAPLDLGVSAPVDGGVEVSVPPHRLDVVNEADVAEEIARVHGYDRIPSRMPAAPLPPFRPDPSAGRHRVRRTLAGLGAHEVVTHALIGPDDLSRSGGSADRPDLIRLVNPVNDEHSVLRPALHPSLLHALRENVRQRRTAAWLFEVGKCYGAGAGARAAGRGHAETAGTGRFESWRVGVALLGPGVPRALDVAARPADVADLQGLLESLHRQLGAPPPRYRPGLPEEGGSHLHPGRSAVITGAGGAVVGWLGEVHPRVAAAWDLAGRPVLAELSLGALLDSVPAVPRATTPPPFQPADRDLAVVVDESVPAGAVLDAVRDGGGPMLVDLELFDRYRGEQLDAGRVSYTLRLHFQPRSPSDDPDEVLASIRQDLVRRLAAGFR